MQFELWLLLAIVAYIVRFTTDSVMLGSVGTAAALAGLLSYFGYSETLQYTVFFSISILWLLINWRMTKKNTEIVKRANVDFYMGERALVIEDISHEKGTGMVLVGQETWRASSAESMLPKGEYVIVSGVVGTRLIVKSPDKEKESELAKEIKEKLKKLDLLLKEDYIGQKTYEKLKLKFETSLKDEQKAANA
jgi:membrane protein implicated in regulation of membrane protease activity